MTITYPLALPDYPDLLESVDLEAASKIAMTPGEFSYSQQIHEHPGQAWRLELRTIKLDRETAPRWMAFVRSLRGQVGTFSAGDPVRRVPRGTAPGAPVVDGAGQAGATLATRGWTASRTGILLAGDLLQVGTGSAARLYENLTDADSDGSGEAILDVWPDVRDAPADGVPITTTDPVGIFRMVSASVPIGWSLGDTARVAISAIEKLP